MMTFLDLIKEILAAGGFVWLQRLGVRARTFTRFHVTKDPVQQSHFSTSLSTSAVAKFPQQVWVSFTGYLVMVVSIDTGCRCQEVPQNSY